MNVGRAAGGATCTGPSQRVPGAPGPTVASRAGACGVLEVALYRADGTMTRQVVHNTITDVGDAHIASRVAAGVPPAAPADTGARLAGIKLGAGNAAAAKYGAGAALAAYTPGSARGFDTGFPTVSHLGSGAGAQVLYQVTWPVGLLTGATFREAALCLDLVDGGDGDPTGVFARALFNPLTKDAGDALVIEWAIRHLA